MLCYNMMCYDVISRILAGFNLIRYDLVGLKGYGNQEKKRRLNDGMQGGGSYFEPFF